MTTVAETQGSWVDAQDAACSPRRTCESSRLLLGHVGQGGLVDIQVRIHVLDVVVVFQDVEQLERGFGFLARKVRLVLWHMVTSAEAGSGMPAFFRPSRNAFEFLGLG